jgi:hypothetical protein
MHVDFKCASVSMSDICSLRSKNIIILIFKIYLTKSTNNICLAYIKINLTKAIPSIKKKLYKKVHKANQMLFDSTFLVPMHMYLLKIKKTK